MNNLLIKSMTLVVLLNLSISTWAATTQGTSFTYQGELVSNNIAVNGIYDITFEFYDASVGGVLAATHNATTVPVNEGIFSVQIDIGDVPFMGNEVWTELKIRQTGLGSFETLLPRLLITNAPYALQSQYVGNDGVGSLAIQNSSVLTRHIANQAITTDKLANSAVTSLQIALGAVGSASIQDGSINNVDIQQGTITAVQLASDSVTQFEIATSAVRSDEILDNSITAADIDSNTVQRRVSAVCPANSSIRQINSDGTVACETDDAGGSTGWALTGNAGTTPGTDFIGTTDSEDFVVKVNNTQAMHFDASSQNIIMGKPTNTMSFEARNSVIGGGGGNIINTNNISTDMTIAGGNSNTINNPPSGFNTSNATISGGSGNRAAGEGATVSGGKNNEATNFLATVIGGGTNQAQGRYATVLGGSTNRAAGDYSVALGQSAVVRSPTAVGGGDTDGDENTFVWSSESTFFSSTGPQQFLVQADGGFGIGTNQPLTPLHVIGEGTSYGSTTGSNEVVMTLQPDTGADVALVLDKSAPAADSALIFSESGDIGYDIRTVGEAGLQFSSYDNNTPTLLMRLIKTISQSRVDFNADLEPQSNNSFNLGASSFRWSNIYSINPVDVSSDRRLKAGINNLGYGLAEILALRPVSYHWKADDKQALHLGLIAQEAEIVIPEIVNQTADEKAMRSMRYTELVPVLIKATQEQQALIEEQSLQIQQLQQMVSKLLASADNDAKESR